MVRLGFLVPAVLALLAQTNGDQRCVSRKFSEDKWELQCHTFSINLNLLRVENQPQVQQLQVRCSNKPDFNLLQNITNLPNFTFHQLDYSYCPMPVGNQSLVDILSRLTDREQISNIKELYFVGNNKYSEHAPVEPALFSNLNKLELLSMKRSTVLPLDNALLFQNLTTLKWLDLREGDGGSRVANSLLRPLTNLEKLELMENGLTELPVGLVSKLPNLKSLTLYKNELHRLDKFVELPNLQDIDLSNNQLTELQENVFDELPALSKLVLNSNLFTSLPKGLLKNNGNLTELLLTDCQLEKLPEGVFTGATGLKHLNLGNNKLQSLPEQLLHGLPNLEELHLEHNELWNTLPDALFRDTVQLRILHLSHNILTDLNANLLKPRKLEELYLDYNQLHAIDMNAFENQSNSLKKLNLSHNRVALHVNGQDVMYKNGQPFVHNRTPFNYLNSVTNLDLSHNEIVTVFQDFKNFMSALVYLNLSHNKIKRLSDVNFPFLSKTIKVINLQSNNITALNIQNSSQLPAAILLDDNPLKCDCQVYDLVQHISAQGLTEQSFPVKGAVCVNPSELVSRTLYNVAPADLICQLDAPNMFCPSECTCYKRRADSTVIVNCNGQNLTAVPAISSPSVLMDKDYSFVELNLANNMLRELAKNGEGWNSVQKLNVANNNLTTLPYDSLPDQLKVMDVSGNQLSKFDAQLARVLIDRTELRNISLSGNPWNCACDDPLLQFVTDNVARITDFTALRCADGEPINSATQKKLCNYRTILIVVLSATVTCLAVVAFICYWLYIHYQHEIKVWLFKHDRLRWLVAEEQIDQDKRYDALISYSHKDEDFVVNKLMPKLESEPMNFKLCWHVRDFMPGELIASQITKAVEESRRTIIVLSPNYIESEWGQMEFDTAFQQSLTDKRNRVIPIIYEDIGDIDKLDAKLRAYLKTNTYVRWDDPWFWDKLRYAMPHPYRIKGVQASNNLRMASIDKLNLLQTATQMSTPSLESTPPIEHTPSSKHFPNSEPLTNFSDPSMQKSVSPYTISNGKIDIPIV